MTSAEYTIFMWLLALALPIIGAVICLIWGLWEGLYRTPKRLRQLYNLDDTHFNAQRNNCNPGDDYCQPGASQELTP
jgi:hypothetical protein